MLGEVPERLTCSAPSMCAGARANLLSSIFGYVKMMCDNSARTSLFLIRKTWLELCRLGCAWDWQLSSYTSALEDDGHLKVRLNVKIPFYSSVFKMVYLFFCRAWLREAYSRLGDLGDIAGEAISRQRLLVR